MTLVTLRSLLCSIVNWRNLSEREVVNDVNGGLIFIKDRIRKERKVTK